MKKFKVIQQELLLVLQVKIIITTRKLKPIKILLEKDLLWKML